MMRDEKAKIIHDFEEKQEIPDALRYTEFIESYGEYAIKLGLKPEKVNDRYGQALLDLKLAHQNEFTLVLEVTLEHNIKDYAEFAIKNWDNMFHQFLTRGERLRRAGIKDNSGVTYLLQIRATDELPEMLDVSDMDNSKELEKIRAEWFEKAVLTYRKNLIKETKELLNLSQSWLAAKGGKFGYAKDIKKRVGTVNMLKDENLEGYDFRSIGDLSGYIFDNCILDDSNFSHCNLTNACFINCSLKGVIFYGAMLNNCKRIDKEPENVGDIYKLYS